MPLFGVGSNGEDDVFIALDSEIEASVPRHPALPHVEGFAVFLGAQGRVIAVGEQELQLLAERSTDDGRQTCVILVGPFRKAQLHDRRFLR